MNFILVFYIFGFTGLDFKDQTMLHKIEVKDCDHYIEDVGFYLKEHQIKNKNVHANLEMMYCKSKTFKIGMNNEINFSHDELTYDSEYLSRLQKPKLEPIKK